MAFPFTRQLNLKANIYASFQSLWRCLGIVHFGVWDNPKWFWFLVTKPSAGFLLSGFMDSHVSFCECLKHQAKILISQYIFSSPLAAVPAPSWGIAHSVYFCLPVIYLLVLSLTMFPNILGLICSIIHLFVKQCALCLIYILWNLELNLHHILIEIEPQI